MASVPKQYFLIFAIFLAIAFGGGVQYGKYMASGSENALALEKVSSPQSEAGQKTDSFSAPEDSFDAQPAVIASQEEEKQAVLDTNDASSATQTQTDYLDIDTQTQTEGEAAQANGKININLADPSLLETLSGIGPVKAQAIVDYRQTNGKFSSIEEINNVSGIGEKTYEKIKERICVD